ncbi:hypothetical protein PybrP1_010022 [[Pythium] brassicae (nom. inval.)]|nr:hypothetical protein PybrP1_010022 [[Pythium] brassicae (nom. inval.)]
MQDEVTTDDASALTPRRAHPSLTHHHQALEGGDGDGLVRDPRHRHHESTDRSPPSGHRVSEHPALSARSLAASLDGHLSDPVGEAATASESGSTWTRPEHKVAAFVILLMEEFLVAYRLEKTGRALAAELQEQNLVLSGTTSSTNLWCEMVRSCRAALARTNSSSSTLEKLVEFCASGAASTRKNFALELMRNPVSVCISPKRTGGRKGSGAFSLMDAHVQTLRSPVVRPSRRAANTALEESSSSSHVQPCSAPSPSLTSSASEPVLSTSTSTGGITTGPGSPHRFSSNMNIPASKTAAKKKHKHGDGSDTPAQRRRHHHSDSFYHQIDKPHSNGHFGSTLANVAVHASFEARTRTPGSYVEPALVLAHEAQLKRELSSVRILERELRHIRLEKIAVEPKRALVKRLGFASLSKAEIRQQRERQDPYLNALVMERLGFAKRAECALCQFAFLQVNLPHRVSFKCIMDVYAKWQYEPPDRAHATKYCAPLCYDSVNVCRMCAQIVFELTATSEGLAGGLELFASSSSSGHGSAARLLSHQSARRAKPDARDESFCSDPYALPPLFADDCYDERSAASRLEDALYDEHRSAPHVESPAKAIVYANQSNELSHFMTTKEWEVISPERSFIREAIESTVKKGR